MIIRRNLRLLAVCCLLAGCSKQRTAPHDFGEATHNPDVRPAIEPAILPATATAAAVPASHVESGPMPADLAPALFERDGEAELNTHDPKHDEADQTLLESMKALRAKLTVISHNLANADTVAFKRSRVLFEDCGYRQLKLPGAQDALNNYAPSSIAVGHGCRVQSVEIDFAQGAFETTNRTFDLAIDGAGFFQVIDPATNSFLYTRTGSFAVNSNGLLVISSSGTGRLVQPQISFSIDTLAVVVSAEGNVSIQQADQTQFSQIGQIQLAKFLNPQGLIRVGEHLYSETLASGAAIFGSPGTNGLGTLRQNCLERSNVDVDEELLCWQATQRTLKTFERLLNSPTR